MTTEWEIGDGLRVLDSEPIQYGEELINGKLYVVKWKDSRGLPQIETDESLYFEFLPEELAFVERIPNAFNEDTSQRNAELGEPSPECNCADIADIREELTDIKSMIGRLLQREQAEVDTLYAHRLNGVNFATGADLAEKASAIIDEEESE